MLDQSYYMLKVFSETEYRVSKFAENCKILSDYIFHRLLEMKRIVDSTEDEEIYDIIFDQPDCDLLFNYIPSDDELMICGKILKIEYLYFKSENGFYKGYYISEFNVKKPEISNLYKFIYDYKNYSYEEIDDSANYANPPIIKGYRYAYGKWHNGFVIENINNGDQYVWIPAGFLEPNGTMDGILYNRRFGRRNYTNDNFSDKSKWDYYIEPQTKELLGQIDSVNKYGGYFLSKYNISISDNRKIMSKKGMMPWIVGYKEAKLFANSIGCKNEFSGHLPFGAEYDTVLEWFRKSGARSLDEIISDSSKWGNYNNYDFASSRRVIKTGLREDYTTNNICDFAGNVSEWTQEIIKYTYKHHNSYPVFRGGDCYRTFPVEMRWNEEEMDDMYIGFRIALQIY